MLHQITESKAPKDFEANSKSVSRSSPQNTTINLEYPVIYHWQIVASLKGPVYKVLMVPSRLKIS